MGQVTFRGLRVEREGPALAVRGRLTFSDSYDATNGDTPGEMTLSDRGAQQLLLVPVAVKIGTGAQVQVVYDYTLNTFRAFRWTGGVLTEYANATDLRAAFGEIPFVAYGKQRGPTRSAGRLTDLFFAPYAGSRKRLFGRFTPATYETGGFLLTPALSQFGLQRVECLQVEQTLPRTSTYFYTYRASDARLRVVDTSGVEVANGTDLSGQTGIRFMAEGY